MNDLTASIRRRITAILVDYCAALLVGGGLALVFEISVINPLFSTVLTVLFWISKSLSEATCGTTPGKKLVNLQIKHHANGNNLSFYNSLARNAWILLEIIPWIGPALFAIIAIFLATNCLRNENSAGLHDAYAHAMVSHV